MEYISFRSLQHYLYCPHRWGLMEIDRAWAENFYVVKANALHERAHSGVSYSLRGRKTYTDVDLWNEELGIIGKTDCIEESKDGLCIVEYKPTKPKTELVRHDDAMQLFAQKLCADAIFETDCKVQIYYADVKRRFNVSFDSSFDSELTVILSEMRRYIARGEVPPVRKKQNCSGCSMKDMCMPQVVKSKQAQSVKAAVMKECEL